MEESWINLNLQHNRSRPVASQEDEAEEVISAPSTDSSTNSSSLDSLQSPEDQNSRSGMTDENLGASLGTLLDRNRLAREGDVRESTAATDKHRRDTITPADKPRNISPDRQERRGREEEEEEEEEQRRLCYWEGFYAGITLGLSTALCGIAIWRVCLARPSLFR